MRQNTTTSADHPVFVTHDGRRARRLRHVAVVVGVLAALWIVGLGVGMLGFGSLPGVALVKGAREHSRPAPAPAVPAPAAGDRAARRVLSADVSSIRSDRSGTAGVRRSANGSTTRDSHAARRAAHASATTPAATPAPVNPAQRTRGWARKGYAAPRGQLRKAAPPPPPAPSRGRRVGQTNTPPAVSPGQAKKALDPPPPPPPPQKG
jgi:hypothetical protein